MDLIKKLNPEWQKIFFKDQITLNTILKFVDKVPKDKLCPEYKNIFSAFTFFKPSETKVVIIGQDPYPGEGVADGLSFSSKKIPQSLKTIFECLVNQKLIAEIPNHGNLTSWAKQGVLLLNAALTTEVGIPNHPDHKIWHNFTQGVISELIKINNSNIEKSKSCRPISFMLWGNFANNLFRSISYEELEIPITKNRIIKSVVVSKRRHPSPLSENQVKYTIDSFVHYRGFNIVNKILKHCNNDPIDWNVPNDDKIIQMPAENPMISLSIFTDGACIRNGKPGAQAGLGVYCSAHGSLPEIKHSYRFSPDEMNSNNRAELLAIDYAVNVLSQLEARHVMEIVTDSNYSKDCLEKFVPGWLKTPSKMEGKKNLDILLPLYEKVNKLRCHHNFKFVHVNSHQKLPLRLNYKSAEEYNRALFLYEGNYKADMLASNAIKNNPVEFL